MEKKYLNLKLSIKMLTFQLDSDRFSNTKSREVSLNGNVYDVLVDYSSIDTSVILKIHKYLMTKKT